MFARFALGSSSLRQAQGQDYGPETGNDGISSCKLRASKLRA
jgi:hypothetical protein